MEDAASLSALLSRQTPEYRRHFSPFAFDEASIASMLNARKDDVFWGLYAGGRMIGFFMLRGWDAGYDVPSLGALYDEEYRGFGLMALTVELSKVICLMRGAKQVMYKAHPDNIPSRSAARLGFTQAGVDPVTQHLIYRLDLHRRQPAARATDDAR
jgi:hypothetical protein